MALQREIPRSLQTKHRAADEAAVVTRPLDELKGFLQMRCEWPARFVGNVTLHELEAEARARPVGRAAGIEHVGYTNRPQEVDVSAD